MTFALDLNTIWYGLVGVLLTGYAVLDGFDLGVGALHLWTKNDSDRRLMLNAIGPFWDGNEVWLVTGGGALFAAFPVVYATVFSGFYLAFMLILFCLIFRAVSIEFRSKEASTAWRAFWDICFSIGSALAALLFGVALGNIAGGIDLDGSHEFMGGFWTLLNPYALLVGITTVALFMMHGALYLLLKTEDRLQSAIRGWVKTAGYFFIICYVVTTLATVLFVPHLTANLIKYPLLFVVPVFNVLAIVNIFREFRRGKHFRAFLSSCLTIVALMAVFGIGMFPNLVPAIPAAENSLTIYNAASSPKTLKIMLVIALIGMPLVIGYTISVYRVFRGKVKLDAGSY
jgi:cytochrome bd ubiquinol oxidase subunit II